MSNMATIGDALAAKTNGATNGKGGKLIPPSSPAIKAGDNKTSSKTQDELVASMVGEIKEPNVLSGDGVMATLWTTLVKHLRPKMENLVKATRATIKNKHMAWEIKKPVLEQNEAELKTLINRPNAAARLMAYLLLSMIEIEQILANNFMPSEFRDVMDNLVSRVLLVTISDTNTKERTFDYRGETYIINNEIRGVAEWKAFADRIDELYLKAEPILAAEAATIAAEKAAREAERIARESKKSVVNVTTDSKPATTPEVKAESEKTLSSDELLVSSDELLDGMTGPTQWVKVGGGFLRLIGALDHKNTGVISVETQDNNHPKASKVPPAHIRVRLQAVNDALAGEEVSFEWAESVNGPRFRKSLENALGWIQSVIKVLVATEKAAAEQPVEPVATVAAAEPEPASEPTSTETPDSEEVIDTTPLDKPEPSDAQEPAESQSEPAIMAEVEPEFAAAS